MLSAFMVGCSGGAVRTADVWGLNVSSNDYVIRVWTADSASTWLLPAGAAGFVITGRNLDVEVLDARTCSLAAARGASGNMLVSVDAQGRVDFVAQPDAPQMNVTLQGTESCPVAPAPTGETTS